MAVQWWWCWRWLFEVVGLGTLYHYVNYVSKCIQWKQFKRCMMWHWRSWWLWKVCRMVVFINMKQLYVIVDLWGAFLSRKHLENSFSNQDTTRSVHKSTRDKGGAKGIKIAARWVECPKLPWINEEVAADMWGEGLMTANIRISLVVTCLNPGWAQTDT